MTEATAKAPKVKKGHFKARHKFLFVAAIVLLFIWSGLNSYWVHWYVREPRDNDHLATLIVRAVDNLNRPTVTDPQTGKEYIPLARIVLPAIPMQLGSVLYQYSPADGDQKATLNLASKADISLAEISIFNHSSDINQLFAAVPKLQACARGVMVSWGKQEGRTADFTKPLSNGQTIHIYTENACPNADLLPYVTQLDSY